MMKDGIKNPFIGRDPDEVWKELLSNPNAKTLTKEELYKELAKRRDAYRAAQAKEEN